MTLIALALLKYYNCIIILLPVTCHVCKPKGCFFFANKAVFDRFKMKETLILIATNFDFDYCNALSSTIFVTSVFDSLFVF